MDNHELNTHFIKVIGHRNPDTDSVCSAIAYSRLKNTLDPEHPCKPCRAGLLNRETEFVLNYFQVPDPQLYTDVSPQIRDVDIRRMEGVDGEMSLRRAWITMRDQQIDTLCVVDKERNLKGLITVKDVATANMDVLDTYILAESETSYQNIVDILDAKVLVGDITGKKVEGRIVIGSGWSGPSPKGTSSSWPTAVRASSPPSRWGRAAWWCARAARCPGPSACWLRSRGV